MERLPLVWDLNARGRPELAPLATAAYTRDIDGDNRALPAIEFDLDTERFGMLRLTRTRLLFAITLLLGQGAIHAADKPMLGRDGANAGNWPQWRGPKRDNRSGDVGLLLKWAEGGPPLSWRIDGLGDGIASIALADGRIFTSTTYGENEFAVALDAETGQRLWATRIAAAVPEQPLMRWLSQRTPTVDGSRLFIFTNNAWLICLDAISGEVVWRVSYPSEFGTQRPMWGFCDRPLVDGDKLICAPGGTLATLVALDKRTGKVIWKKLLESRERNGFASTLMIQTAGLKQYVAFLAKGIASFAADDGRLLWRSGSIRPAFRRPNRRSCNGLPPRTLIRNPASPASPSQTRFLCPPRTTWSRKCLSRPTSARTMSYTTWVAATGGY
jgi:hypothetical protein